MKLLNLLIAFLLVSGTAFSQRAGDIIALNTEKVNNAVAITWTPAVEVETNYFEIQKSKDGTNWKVIALMFPYEDASVSHSYIYVDKSLKGNCYYRIRQIDRNKREIFSKVTLFSNKITKK